MDFLNADKLNGGRLRKAIASIYKVLHLLKFKAINYVFPLPRLNAGCTYSLMPFSASAITPTAIKNGPDCGYIVVLPPVEVLDESNTKIREIGSYCIPISFVQTSESVAAEAGRFVSHHGSVVKQSHKLLRDKSRDDLMVRAREWPVESKYKRREEAKAEEKGHENYNRTNQGRSNHASEHAEEGGRILGVDSNYTAASFKHLRSIEHYITPEQKDYGRRTTHLPEGQQRALKTRERNVRQEEFSFDVYANERERLSPLDEIEKYVGVDEIYRYNDQQAARDQIDRVARGDGVQQERSRNRRITEYRPSRRLPDDHYMPPFKNSEVLNKISESPVTSPRVTSKDRGNSGDKNYEPRIDDTLERAHRQGTFGATDHPKGGLDLKRRGFDPTGNKSDNTYPGSLLNTHSSKK